MRIMRKLLPFLILPMLVAGCSSVTNLTPHTERSTANYHFEMKWNNTQHALKPGTAKAYVLIGDQSFPMQPTPIVKNRFETSISLNTSEPTIRYRYKIDYEVSAVPSPRQESTLSPEYKLDISGKK